MPCNIAWIIQAEVGQLIGPTQHNREVEYCYAFILSLTRTNLCQYSRHSRHSTHRGHCGPCFPYGFIWGITKAFEEVMTIVKTQEEETTCQLSKKSTYTCWYHKANMDITLTNLYQCMNQGCYFPPSCFDDSCLYCE